MENATSIIMVANMEILMWRKTIDY